MLFRNSEFILLLVITLFIYWRAFKTDQARVTFASVAGLLFIYLTDQHSLTVYCLLALILQTSVVFYAGSRLRHRPGLIWLIGAVALPLGALLYFKVAHPLLYRLDIVPELFIPLGISYYTFKHIHYLVECSRGNFANAGLSTYFSYIFFFPIFLAGPIERFGNFSRQIGTLRFSWSDISAGGERILVGCFKKIILADFLLKSLLPPATGLSGGAPEYSWYLVLLACVIKLLATYMDFSGYTDMALGTARLFGITICENFNFPLLRSNLAEFWRTWHMSLSGWARDYVYLPLLGRYRSTSLSLLATMLTIGCWHGLQPGWFLWGLHHGSGLIILSYFHRWSRGKPRLSALRASMPWRLAATALVWVYVAMGYALTFYPDRPLDGLRLNLKILTFGMLT